MIKARIKLHGSTFGRDDIIMRLSIHDALHRKGRTKQNKHKKVHNGVYGILLNYPYVTENFSWWLEQVLNNRILLKEHTLLKKNDHIHQCCWTDFIETSGQKKNKYCDAPRFTNVIRCQLQQLVEVALTCVCSFRQTEKWGNRRDDAS